MNPDNKIPVVRIHKDTPMECIIGQLESNKVHGLTVTRNGKMYKVEMVG